MPQSDKIICSHAIVIYIFAKKVLSDKDFKKIKMPDIDIFNKEYVEYLLNNKIELKMPFDFPEELDVAKEILMTKPQRIYLKDRILDDDKMLDDFASKIKEKL